MRPPDSANFIVPRSGFSAGRTGCSRGQISNLSQSSVPRPRDRFQICPGFTGFIGSQRPRIQIPHQIPNTPIRRKTRRCRFKNRQRALAVKGLAGVLQLLDGVSRSRMSLMRAWPAITSLNGKGECLSMKIRKNEHAS